MKRWMRALWLVPIAAGVLFWLLQGPRQPTCTDFLARDGLRLEALRFKSCAPNRLAQVPVLRARYEIPGAQAAQLEAQLRARYGMAPLKFVCCFWEPEGGRNGQRPDALGLMRVVRMTSEETVYNGRADWTKIKRFFVHVDVLLEEP